MKLRRLTIVVVLVVSTGVLAQDRSPVAPAGELINAVVANELRDRVQLRKWMYVIEKREGKQSITKEQVETAKVAALELGVERVEPVSEFLVSCS